MKSYVTLGNRTRNSLSGIIVLLELFAVARRSLDVWVERSFSEDVSDISSAEHVREDCRRTNTQTLKGDTIISPRSGDIFSSNTKNLTA
jgi:hypothetical protein